MRFHNVDLHNVEALIDAEAGVLLSRVPLAVRDILNENAYIRTTHTTGVELRFQLLSESARITLQSDALPGTAEVYVGPFLMASPVIGTTPTTIEVTHPVRAALLPTLTAPMPATFDLSLFRVLLPWNTSTCLISIEGDVTPPTADLLPATRYLAYGSSITHGNSGGRASGMYAMRTAQKLGVDLINLGFGGGAHLEPQMADFIANRNDWQFATLELGINLFPREVSVEEFQRRVQYFVETVAGAHPTKPIFVIDMFTFYGDFDPALQPRAADFRRVVRDCVPRLKRPTLTHIDGRDLLRSPAGLQADVLHPSPVGMEAIAHNLAQRLAQVGVGQPAPPE